MEKLSQEDLKFMAELNVKSAISTGREHLTIVGLAKILADVLDGAELKSLMVELNKYESR